MRRILYACGYSPISMIRVLFSGGSMSIAGASLGSISFKLGVNIGEGCSAAISAACHPPVAHELDKYQMTC